MTGSGQANIFSPEISPDLLQLTGVRVGEVTLPPAPRLQPHLGEVEATAGAGLPPLETPDCRLPRLPPSLVGGGGVLRPIVCPVAPLKHSR